MQGEWRAGLLAPPALGSRGVAVRSSPRAAAPMAAGRGNSASGRFFLLLFCQMARDFLFHVFVPGTLGGYQGLTGYVSK